MMKNLMIHALLAIIFSFGVCTIPAIAADSEESKSEAGETANFDTLLGEWVRPDGGYTINITSVAPDGKLEARYANPRPLPFAQAQASLDDGAIKVFLELRAGGYNGSTYNLTYDPASNMLKGIYYQAIEEQKYDIFFKRVE
jgi:hypothetical protein